jgi:hypothetical protein
MNQPDPTALLRDAENYLSALHGSVARHDNLAANFGCAGCELRDQIRAALAEPAAQSPADRAAGHACSNCDGVDPGTCLANPDRAALRDRIAEALTAAAHECDGNCGLTEQECYDAHPINFSARVGGTTHVDAPVTAIADAVLAVLPESADRAVVRAEAFHEAAEAITGHAADHIPEEYDQYADQLADVVRRLAGEQPAPSAEVEQPRAATEAVTPAPTALRIRVLTEILGRLGGTSEQGDSATEDVGGTTVRAVLAEILAEMTAPEQPAQDEALPSSTAPLASGLPLVKGNCPACGHASLFLGSGGYVTCSIAACREPDAASRVLEQPPSA